MRKNNTKTAPVVNPWPADTIERRKVSDLTPYANNCRLHSDGQIAQIAKSIEEFGFTMPVLVDPDGGIHR